jgi:hypothetical protein
MPPTPVNSGLLLLPSRSMAHPLASGLPSSGAGEPALRSTHPKRCSRVTESGLRPLRFCSCRSAWGSVRLPTQEWISRGVSGLRACCPSCTRSLAPSRDDAYDAAFPLLTSGFLPVSRLTPSRLRLAAAEWVPPMSGMVAERGSRHPAERGCNPHRLAPAPQVRGRPHRRV